MASAKCVQNLNQVFDESQSWFVPNPDLTSPNPYIVKPESGSEVIAMAWAKVYLLKLLLLTETSSSLYKAHIAQRYEDLQMGDKNQVCR